MRRKYEAQLLRESFPAIHEPPTFISDCECKSILTFSRLAFHYRSNARTKEEGKWHFDYKCLSGRTVIITGADIGIGLETVIQLYSRYTYRVILAARDLKRGEDAKAWIERYQYRPITNYPKHIEVWELDLNSFDSVKRFANRCMAELSRLDILLLNAAVATPSFSMTVDGYETTVQTNVLSTFLLSALLMPLLQKTARMGTPEEGSELKPHLVLVSSDAHVAASFSQKNARSIYKALNKSLWFNGCERYRTTKLMALLLLRQLSYASGEKEKNDVVICAANPGFSKLEKMEKTVGWWRRLVYKRFATKTWQAAHDIEWTCLENDIPSGSYVSHRIISDCASWIDTPQGQKVQFKLWKETGDILSKVAPETEKLWNVKGF